MSDVVVKGPSSVQALANEFWGEMDSGDFKIPRVSIGQPTTKQAKGKPGHFNYSNGKSIELIENVKLILPKKTRVLYQGNNRARCKSDNFYQPSAYVQDPISNDCLKCPAAQWGDRDRVKVALAEELQVKDVEKPLCSETYNLLMADGNWMPFWANFQKAQLKIVGEQLFSRLRYDYNHVPPYGVAFDMRLKKIENGMNSYYTVTFDSFRVLDSYEPGAKLYQALSKRAQEILAQEHENMDRAHDQAASEPPGFDANEEIPF